MAEREPVKFGTSGLRGPATGFTPGIVNAYVTAFLDTCCRNAQSHDVAIGMDLRTSSPDILAEIATVLTRQGWTPINCGLLPTPALAAFALHRAIPAIMVTGSHIPPQYNGLKFYRPDGELGKDDESPIELLVATGRFQTAGDVTDADAISLPLPKHDAVDAYIERYTAAFPKAALAGMRIGVFEHSAVGRDLLVEILERLGAKITRFGRSQVFVAIDTEALEPDHLELAREILRAQKLDAIVSTDGDGDRPLLIDEQGNQIIGDVLGALTARFLKADTVVTPLTSTSAIEKSGWFDTVHRTRIGSPYVVAAMTKLRDNAVVGFEANGGFLTGSAISLGSSPLALLPTRDAVLPILAVLAMSRAEERPLALLYQDLPARVMRGDRLKEIPSQSSAAFLKEMAISDEARKAFDACLAGPVAIDTLDGTRLTLSDGTIVHFRASGNAPEFRCYVETDSADRTADLLARMMTQLNRHFARSNIS